ncbi:pyridoxamine 5'-phosphate oxidase family protein [Streptomyces sp. NPDC050504]|uniref:pyridoxamine 5'-phosphate oxidase family protein n=1 Tax=Streptomyces sp. NPDC050504 TaxID=3365618 RepID=UPI0037AF8A72
MAHDPRHPAPEYLAFWREKHYATLTTPRRDGTPHVVPVCVTYDPEAGVARVIASKSSTKVRNVLAAEGTQRGARVALCQVAGARWATLEGRAVVRTGRAEIAEAERRHTERYERTPRPNPDRVLIEVTLDRALGKV